MYGPGACVTIQSPIRAPTALPDPLAWQEGVILLGPQSVWGKQTRCPGSPIQRPEGNLGHPRIKDGLGDRVAYCLRTASYQPSQVDGEKG